MTTGRINQVTIVETPPGPEGSGGLIPRPTPRKARCGGTEIVVFPRRGRERAGAVQACPAWDIDQPPRRGDRPETIQLPPLSSPKAGPPQKLVRQAVRPTTPRLQHTALERRIPRSRSRRPVGRRLPAAAYPQKSGENPSQRPIIRRPHPHRKHAGLSEFRAPSRPPRRGRQSSARPPPRPERA